MGSIIRRLRYWLFQRSQAAELAEEIEFHRALTQADLERSGLTPDEARARSRRVLGNTILAREDARDVWIWPSFERLWQDIRYGVRGMRRQPGFAAAAILTLTVGIAATTTVFSVVEAELWKPLPFPDVHRLVDIRTTGPGVPPAIDPISGPDLLDLQVRSQSFEGIAAHASGIRRVLRGQHAPEFVRTVAVTGNFFSTLHWSPAIGPSFSPNAAAEVILTDDAWHRLFNADREIVGRPIVLDDRTYTVVGVMAPDARLEFTDNPDIFIGIDFTSQASQDRNRRAFSAFGRLKAGVTLSAAEAELRAIASQFATEYPDSHIGRSIAVEDLSASAAGYNWRPLYFFLAAALVLLALSAINVANMLLARALGRQREFAVRAALGGGSASLVRQLLAEGAVLALPGTIGGVLLSIWAIGIFSAAVPGDYLVHGGRITIDARVCAFAFVLCGLTTIAFGLAPAFFTRLDLSSTLSSGARTVVGSHRQRRLRHALVVAEIMTAFVLVFGAGLFLNSFVRLTKVPLGFDPTDRFTVYVSLTGDKYADRQATLNFANSVLERAQSQAGVSRAVVATSVPLGSGPIALFGIGGQPIPARGDESRAVARAVTPGYFDTLSIRRLAGRDFTDQDVSGSPRVVIVNEAVARRFFADANPIGREIVLLPGSRTPWLGPATLQVVGVVANTKDVGINEIEFHNLYLPFAQQPVSPLQLVVHGAVPPERLIDQMRQSVLAVDRDLPMPTVTTMSTRVENAFRGDRFHLLLIGMFASAALLLAAVSVYAAMSYAVEQRTSEFGLRLALGAQTTTILRLALGQSSRLGVLGTALGLALSLVLARAIGDALYLVPRAHNGLIYGVTTTDPLTLACTCALLIVVALAAGYIPARRAASVDPAVALRGE